MNTFALAALGVGEAFADAILGYLTVFIGLSLLMCVVMLVGKVMTSAAKKAAPAAPAAPEAPAKIEKPKAPGSAGELRLYDTDPKTAAMLMAIVADTMGKPINELHFKSIREIKD